VVSICSCRLLKPIPRFSSSVSDLPKYITRVRRKTCSISSCLGTLPNSSWRAAAIFALRSLAFCSLEGAGFIVLVMVTIIVSKLIMFVKEWNIDCETVCETIPYAGLPRFLR
jgi:hypothetical protein